MLPYTVRRVDRGHVLLRDGWVARAPAPISPPCDLPVTAYRTTALPTRTNEPSKTPPPAASRSLPSMRPRCASPASPATPTTAHHRLARVPDQRTSPCLAHRLAHSTACHPRSAPSSTASSTAATSPTLARLARRRAAQRWSALVSAPDSRLARQTRPHLGAGRACESSLQGGWLRALAPASGVLRCVGALDGAPCAHTVLVDLRAGTGTGGGLGREWGGSARSARPSTGCTWKEVNVVGVHEYMISHIMQHS